MENQRTNTMAAASKAKKELAAERDKLAGLKHEKQALEQQLAAAAARDADACAAAARAMRAAVAATPLESDPAADARRDLREKRATLREQQALLAAWTGVARANAAGDVEALAAVTNEAGPVAAAPATGPAYFVASRTSSRGGAALRFCFFFFLVLRFGSIDARRSELIELLSPSFALFAKSTRQLVTRLRPVSMLTTHCAAIVRSLGRQSLVISCSKAADAPSSINTLAPKTPAVATTPGRLRARPTASRNPRLNPLWQLQRFATVDWHR